LAPAPGSFGPSIGTLPDCLFFGLFCHFYVPSLSPTSPFSSHFTFLAGCCRLTQAACWAPPSCSFHPFIYFVAFPLILGCVFFPYFRPPIFPTRPPPPISAKTLPPFSSLLGKWRLWNVPDPPLVDLFAADSPVLTWAPVCKSPDRGVRFWGGLFSYPPILRASPFVRPNAGLRPPSHFSSSGRVSPRCMNTQLKGNGVGRFCPLSSSRRFAWCLSPCLVCLRFFPPHDFFSAHHSKPRPSLPARYLPPTF